MLIIWWVKYSQFGLFLPFWFFWLIASPPIDSSDWLFLPILILLIDCFSLFWFLWLNVPFLWFFCLVAPLSFDSPVWLLLSLLILMICFSLFFIHLSLFDWYSPSLASYVWLVVSLFGSSLWLYLFIRSSIWLLLSSYLLSFIWLYLSIGFF